MMAAKPIRERLGGLDWQEIERSLDTLGYAQTPALLDVRECRGLISLYDDDARFRSRIEMERYRFGIGDYAYFSHPLPPVVREMRTHAYRHLAPIANRWARALGRKPVYPPSLKSFLDQCHAKGQCRPTPLLLHYEAQGYNCLHQDLYGDIHFPLQIAGLLSRPGIDYEGGELLLVENRAREQSLGDALTPGHGELVIFPTFERPIRGKRGYVKAQMRHGVSRLHRGSRYTLGLIFHDAR